MDNSNTVISMGMPLLKALEGISLVDFESLDLYQFIEVITPEQQEAQS